MKTITIDVIKGTADVHAVEGDVGVKVIITNTPSEWDNCTVYALLTQGPESQHIQVIDDTFKIPSAFTDANKAFKFCVYAVGANASRDVRPSIWIRVADSDFTTEDIEITKQTLDGILMLQSQYTQYQNAEKGREDAEAVRVSNEEQRIDAEAKRDRDLSKISDDIERLDNSVDDLEENKVDRIAGFGLSSFMSGGIGIYNDRKDETLVLKLYNREQIDNLLTEKAEKKELSDLESAISNEIAKSISDAIAKLVNNSPEALDTIYELAKALGDNPNFAATVMDAIGKKVDKINGYGLANVDYSFSLNNPNYSIILRINQNNATEEIELYSKENTDSLLSGKVDTLEYEQFKNDLSQGNFEVNKADYANRASDATNARNDWDGNDIQQTYAKIRPDIMTNIPGTLSPNQTYHLYEVPSSIVFPSSDIVDGDTIYLTFMTGETAPTVKFNTTNTTDIDIEIKANTGYEIYGKYVSDIGKWILGYSEYTVTDGETI